MGLDPDNERNGLLSSTPDSLQKKPYQRPAFRHERVFETMALACGKINTTQLSCQSNRKNS